jgi:hypothetical protein
MTFALKRIYWQWCAGKRISAVLMLFGLQRLEQLVFVTRMHRGVCGQPPKLLRPHRFRDRLLRIMLSADGRSRLRTRITDKEHLKEFVAERLGPNMTPKTYAVFTSVDALLRSDLPDQCAIKTTHDSGGIVLRRNGEPIDVTKLSARLADNYYMRAREPNYRSLKPKLLVEELLQGDPPDFKFFCFRGVPAFVQVDVGRFTRHERAFYSPRWKRLGFTMNYPSPTAEVSRPAAFTRMLDVARELARGFSFIRVDLYEVNGRVLVGELTNFPEATLMKFSPDSADFLIGSLFDDPYQDIEKRFAAHDGLQASSNDD